MCQILQIYRFRERSREISLFSAAASYSSARARLLRVPSRSCIHSLIDSIIAPCTTLYTLHADPLCCMLAQVHRSAAAQSGVSGALQVAACSEAQLAHCLSTCACLVSFSVACLLFLCAPRSPLRQPSALCTRLPLLLHPRLP